MPVAPELRQYINSRITKLVEDDTLYTNYKHHAGIQNRLDELREMAKEFGIPLEPLPFTKNMPSSTPDP